MRLDDALRGTLRNFSTLFLVLFIVMGPLHLVYGLAFHDVLALRELHAAIADFPPSRQVRGVGRAALDQARLWLWIVFVIELAALPLFARATGHVVADDEAGRVPTALGAWRRLRSSSKAEVGPAPGGRRWATIGTGAVIGAAVGSLTEAALMVVADLVAAGAAPAVIALARAAGHSAGGAFALGAFVYARMGEHRAAADEVLDLY